jgi:hypothetical protein
LAAERIAQRAQNLCQSGRAALACRCKRLDTLGKSTLRGGRIAALEALNLDNQRNGPTKRGAVRDPAPIAPVPKGADLSTSGQVADRAAPAASTTKRMPASSQQVTCLPMFSSGPESPGMTTMAASLVQPEASHPAAGETVSH